MRDVRTRNFATVADYTAATTKTDELFEVVGELEAVTDTVTGETYLNKYDNKGFTTESTFLPREGIDHCFCGSKYWDGNTCHSCGTVCRSAKDLSVGWCR